MAIPLSSLKVACILDEFSFECFRHECIFIKFTPSNWQSILSKEKPDLLLVESAWKGNDDSWEFKVGQYSNDPGTDIANLVRWCKQLKIPTVFWNKEDPTHFNKFKKTARLFDFILTTDEGCLNRYRKMGKNGKVFVMPFAAQPKIHNPIRVDGHKEKNICFAGSYYGNQHRKRSEDIQNLLDISTEYGLDIYDRNFTNPLSPFKFPMKYTKYIKGSIPYDHLTQVCKKYKVCLNVNSVKHSRTMCSRRVFELLASGVTVVSSYSKAMDYIFRNIIPTVKNREDTKKVLEKALHQEEWRIKKELEGIRFIYQRHTYRHRLSSIAKLCNIDVCIPLKKVQVFSIANNERELAKILAAFNKQLYPNKELNIVLGDSLEVKQLSLQYHDSVNFLDDSSMNVRLSKLCKKDYCFATYIDPFHHYGPNFLIDLINASFYTQSKIIGKKSFFQYIPSENEITIYNKNFEYMFTDYVLSTACIIHRDILEKEDINILNLMEQLIFNRKTSKYKKFSVNPYNYINNLYKDQEFESKDMLFRVDW